MKWKEAFATGSKEIDEQHKTLFENTESFRESLKYGCSPETYEGFLEFLAMYVRFHFGFEEDCMHAHKCPIACQNKQEHAHFMKIVETEEQAFEQKGFDPQRALKLIDILDVWLETHICKIDIQLKGYIGENKQTVDNPRP